MTAVGRVPATCVAVFALVLTSPPPAGAQDSTALTPTLQPSVGQAIQPGVGQATQPGALETLQSRNLGARVFQVDPDVLSRMTRQAAPSPAPDTARFITSRIGTEALRNVADQATSTGRNTYVLPYRVLATSAGASGSERRSFLRPVIEVAGDGLSFAGSEEGFRGTLFLGVQDSLQPASAEPLPDTIHFLLDAAGARVDPGRIRVAHTNLPFEEVTVSSRENRDSVELRVRSSLWAEAVPLSLPVSRPALTVTAPPTVPGLGLEAANVVVRSERIVSGRVPVTVESTLGRPEPSGADLGPDGTLTVELRSTGLGEAEITVHSPGYRPASTTVRFVFPVGFLLAALLGGVVGGSAHRIQKRKEEEADSWIREAGAGLVFGMIVAVAYAVGVNLLGLELQAQYGEALVFTLAALGGYFRVPLRERARPESA